MKKLPRYDNFKRSRASAFNIKLNQNDSNIKRLIQMEKTKQQLKLKNKTAQVKKLRQKIDRQQKQKSEKKKARQQQSGDIEKIIKQTIEKQRFNRQLWDIEKSDITQQQRKTLLQQAQRLRGNQRPPRQPVVYNAGRRSAVLQNEDELWQID